MVCDEFMTWLPVGARRGEVLRAKAQPDRKPIATRLRGVLTNSLRSGCAFRSAAGRARAFRRRVDVRPGVPREDPFRRAGTRSLRVNFLNSRNCWARQSRREPLPHRRPAQSCAANSRAVRWSRAGRHHRRARRRCLGPCHLRCTSVRGVRGGAATARRGLAARLGSGCAPQAADPGRAPGLLPGPHRARNCLSRTLLRR